MVLATFLAEWVIKFIYLCMRERERVCMRYAKHNIYTQMSFIDILCISLSIYHVELISRVVG